MIPHPNTISIPTKTVTHPYHRESNPIPIPYNKTSSDTANQNICKQFLYAPFSATLWRIESVVSVSYPVPVGSYSKAIYQGWGGGTRDLCSLINGDKNFGNYNTSPHFRYIIIIQTNATSATGGGGFFFFFRSFPILLAQPYFPRAPDCHNNASRFVPGSLKRVGEPTRIAIIIK